MFNDLKNMQGWLMIIYHVPSTPSTSRVTIWKRIKELGAFLLQQSVYILPNLPSVKATVSQLKEQVIHLGGECKVIEIASLGEEQEKEVIAGFNSNREEEYAEVIKACNEFVQEIDLESGAEDFHFAHLEENEKHIHKVRELFENVANRDYFGSEQKAKAIELMKKCEEQYEKFSHEVFSHEGVVTEEKKTPLESSPKHKQKQILSKIELINKVQEILDGLNRDVLKVSNNKFAELPDMVNVEWDFTEDKNEKTLEIKMIWSVSKSKKKIGTR